ncbi:site-specific integrase [Salmonella enterica]|nr:site-specific integrase [Salmonella enterica]
MTPEQKKQIRIILEEAQANYESTGRPQGLYLDEKTREIIGKVDSKPTEETKQQYRKLYKSILEKPSNKGRSLQSILLDCKTKASFDKTRTAIRFCIIEEIKQLRSEADKARKLKLPDEMFQKTYEAFKKAYIFEDDFLSDKRLIFSESKSVNGYKSASHSKKKTMKKAPSENEILTKMNESNKIYDRHSLHFSVAAVFGCRPSEIQKGIKVVIDEHGRLCAFIKGSKLGLDQGQEYRVCHSALRPDNKADVLLYRMITRNGGELFIKPTKADYHSLRKYLNKNFKNSPSLYTYRHRVGSDLKTSGLDKTTIAQFLGHRTTKSQQSYGFSKSGNKRKLNANASEEVKIKEDIKDYKSRKTPPRIKRKLGV